MSRFLRQAAALLLAALLLLPAAPMARAAETASFPDTAGSWCAQAVEQMAQRGILSGYRDGTFRPNGKVTRGEAAKMIGAAVDSLPYTLPQTGQGSFSDIESHWARRNIRQLIVEGVIRTQDYGKNFGPNQNITRLEMVRMLMRMLGFSSGQAAQHTFSDLSGLSFLDQFYCEKAAQIGLVEGYADGTFRPDAPLTRGQAAALLHRALPRTYLPMENLSAYEADPTVPQIDEFVPAVPGSQAAGVGQYQGQPMYVHRYTLSADAGSAAVKEGLVRYFQVLNLQRYTQVGAETENGSSTYWFCDLLGKRLVLITLRQKDPDTGLPSLTVSLTESDLASQTYDAFAKALGVKTLFDDYSLSPAEFLLYADANGVNRQTEVYDLSLLPAGASQQFLDDLLTAGYTRQADSQLAGAPAEVYAKGKTAVAISTLEGFWAVMLLQD